MILKTAFRLSRSRRLPISNRIAIPSGAAIAVISSLATISYFAPSETVYNDASPDPRIQESSSSTKGIRVSEKELLENLKAYAWGSNAASVLGTGAEASTRNPGESTLLSGVPLRDACIHQWYAAVVDTSGDVWSMTSADSRVCLLKGKDIQCIVTSPKYIFALSRKGKIYRLEPSVEDNGSSSKWFSFLWSTTDERELLTATHHIVQEKFASISAGRDHLLAVNMSGKAFAHPITVEANSTGQLGLRAVRVLEDKEGSHSSEHSTLELVPRAQADPYANASPFIRAGGLQEGSSTQQLAPLLYEIPSLKNVTVSQAVASDRSSYVLTKDSGRVLAWGANEFGQLGLGSAVTLPFVSVPTELMLSRSYPTGTSIKCTDISAGGDVAFFTVENSSIAGKTTSVDVLAVGMGQWGALGNNAYSQAQSTPVRVKTISGNVMFNEQKHVPEAIRPYAFSVSPNPTSGHVFAALSSGKDLLVWGANSAYQLGNGKRASLSVPTYVRDFQGILHETGDVEDPQQGRMKLRAGTVKEARDLSGRRAARNIKVQQWPVAGFNASMVYWRVVS